MIVMGERQDPFEVIDIYNHRILANQSKAAIRRVKRDKSIEPGDMVVFKKLSQLLEAAYIGDQSVSGSQIRASSTHSLKILAQTFKAMEGVLRNTKVFRETLDDLNKASIELSQNKVISDDRLDSLYEFCNRYAALQQQLLKQSSTKPSYGITVWPFERRIKHI